MFGHALVTFVVTFQALFSDHREHGLIPNRRWRTTDLLSHGGESGRCEVKAGQELSTTRRLMGCSKCRPHSGNLPGPRLRGSYGFDGRPLAGSPVQRVGSRFLPHSDTPFAHI